MKDNTICGFCGSIFKHNIKFEDMEYSGDRSKSKKGFTIEVDDKEILVLSKQCPICKISGELIPLRWLRKHKVSFSLMSGLFDEEKKKYHSAPKMQQRIINLTAGVNKYKKENKQLKDIVTDRNKEIKKLNGEVVNLTIKLNNTFLKKTEVNEELMRLKLSIHYKSLQRTIRGRQNTIDIQAKAIKEKINIIHGLTRENVRLQGEEAFRELMNGDTDVKRELNELWISHENLIKNHKQATDWIDKLREEIRMKEKTEEENITPWPEDQPRRGRFQ